MEKEKKRGTFAVKKRNVMAASALAVAISYGSVHFSSEGHETYDYIPVPNNDFKPVIIYDRLQDRSLDIIPYSTENQIEVSRKVLSKEDLKKQQEEKELAEVIDKMNSNKDVFSNKYINDVKMYYPIYKTVADKFNIDWYLIFIVHEKETGASAGTKGFAPDSYYKGAMQRDPNVWDNGFVDNASKGLDFLADLPQRHKNDWKEIATGAAILNRNIDHQVELGKSENEAVYKALILYSADWAAKERFAMYKEYKSIFSN